jgi:hypothetical protein
MDSLVAKLSRQRSLHTFYMTSLGLSYPVANAAVGKLIYYDQVRVQRAMDSTADTHFPACSPQCNCHCHLCNVISTVSKSVYMATSNRRSFAKQARCF